MSEVDGRKGVAGEELLEMTIMALQDMEPEEAADIVLEYKLKDPVSAGIRKNIIKDLLDNDSPWEECADIRFHKIFLRHRYCCTKLFFHNFKGR